MENDNLIQRYLAYEKTKEFEITSMRQIPPIRTNVHVNDDNEIRWFKVESREQLETLNKAFEGEFECSLGSDDFKPEVYCIEIDQCTREAYSYTLTEMLESTKQFWAEMADRGLFKEEKA